MTVRNRIPFLWLSRYFFFDECVDGEEEKFSRGNKDVFVGDRKTKKKKRGQREREQIQSVEGKDWSPRKRKKKGEEKWNTHTSPETEEKKKRELKQKGRRRE